MVENLIFDRLIANAEKGKPSTNAFVMIEIRLKGEAT